MITLLAFITTVASIYNANCFQGARQQLIPLAGKEYTNYGLPANEDKNQSVSKELLADQLRRYDHTDLEKMYLEIDNHPESFTSFEFPEFDSSDDSSLIIVALENIWKNLNELDRRGDVANESQIRLPVMKADTTINQQKVDIHRQFEIPELKATNDSSALIAVIEYQMKVSNEGVTEKPKIESYVKKTDTYAQQNVNIHKPFQIPELETTNDSSSLLVFLENQKEAFDDGDSEGGVTEASQIGSYIMESAVTNNQQNVNIHKPLQIPELEATKDSSLLLAVIVNEAKVFNEGDSQGAVVEEPKTGSDVTKTDINEQRKVNIQKPFQFPELEETNDSSLLHVAVEYQVKDFNKGDSEGGTAEVSQIGSYIITHKTEKGATQGKIDGLRGSVENQTIGPTAFKREWASTPSDVRIKARLKRANAPETEEECPNDEYEMENYRRKMLSMKRIKSYWNLFPSPATSSANTSNVELVSTVVSDQVE